MTVALLTVRLYAPWVHSLKQKRMELQSLLARIRNRFNVSACEAGEQDTHQILVIGVAALAANPAQADSILDHLLNFIESNSQAQLLLVERELR